MKMVACVRPSPRVAFLLGTVELSVGPQRSGETSTMSRRRVTRMEWRTPTWIFDSLPRSAEMAFTLTATRREATVPRAPRVI